MSLFKEKQWWSNQSVKSELKSCGVQNSNCLKVDRFSSHSDSDCVLVAEDNGLKIYKPSNVEEVTANVILETEFNTCVLGIDTGKFTQGAADRQILLLHPQSYEIYDLSRKEGLNEAGDQNTINQIARHTFKRKAHSIITGPFGGIKNRDLICVQGLDGSLSFFDQDTFLFMCILDDVIIPGAVSYAANSDQFVLYKNTWVLEIYSYQQLREFSELNARQNKKQVPQWIYNAGEEITALQVIQTSNNFSSILALGERHIYCFQDNGLMKFMKKLDYMPMCFYAYLIGWYYDPASRLLTMVGSEDSKLFIYEGPTLLWSCDLFHVPINLSRCYLKGLPGGIVTLSNAGLVTVSYLGTLPDLHPVGPAMTNDSVSVEETRAQLETAESELLNILDRKDNDENINTDKLIKIKADAGKPIKTKLQPLAFEESELVDACPIIIILTCDEPKLIQAVQITYICHTPFSCTDTTICINTINGTEIIETHVYLSNKYDISDPNVKIMLTITEATGKILVTSRNVLLPLSLYCTLSYSDISDDIAIDIETNTPCVNLADLFSEFSKEDISTHKFPSDSISFDNISSEKTVVVTAKNQHYFIKSQDTPDTTPILETLIYKLMENSVRMKVKGFKVKIKLSNVLKAQVVMKFLKSIEFHAKKKIILKSLEREMDALHRQFTLIQKKLLVQYGSTPPGDCSHLEFLMRDTHDRITQCAYAIIACKHNRVRAGCTMAANGRLLTLILKMVSPDQATVKLAEEMLSIDSLYEEYQDWEESVTQSLSYVLNNILKKSERDREKLAPVTDQGVLSLINLKRFLRQIRIIFEQIFTDAEETADELLDKAKTDNDRRDENRVTRIEELVEVL